MRATRANPCFALGTWAWLRTRRRHVDAGCGVGSIVADLRRRTGRSRPDDDVVIKVIIILVVKIGLCAAAAIIVEVKRGFVEGAGPGRVEARFYAGATADGRNARQVKIIIVIVMRAAWQRQRAEMQLAADERLGRQPPVGDGAKGCKDAAAFVLLVVINLHLLFLAAHHDFARCSLGRSRSLLLNAAAKDRAGEGEQPQRRQRENGCSNDRRS